MIDTRALGQELQEQVLAAARKGRRRVTTTVRNVTATAQMIRPQLPAMPPITIKLPSADQLAQLTERQLSQLREKAPGLIARLPDADDIRASAADFAEQVQSVQRQVADRVRTVASPLAHQAATALAQATVRQWVAPPRRRPRAARPHRSARHTRTRRQRQSSQPARARLPPKPSRP